MLQDLGNLLHNKSHYLKAEDISGMVIQKWSSCVMCMWWVRSVKRWLSVFTMSACCASWVTGWQSVLAKSRGHGQVQRLFALSFLCLATAIKRDIALIFLLVNPDSDIILGCAWCVQGRWKKQNGSRGWGKGSEGWCQISVFKTRRKTLFFWWQGCQSKLWCSTKSMKQVQGYKTESIVLTDGNSSYIYFPVMSLKLFQQKKVSSIMLSLLYRGFRPLGEVCPALRSPREKTPGLRTVLLMTQLMTEELGQCWCSQNTRLASRNPAGMLFL